MGAHHPVGKRPGSFRIGVHADLLVSCRYGMTWWTGSRPSVIRVLLHAVDHRTDTEAVVGVVVLVAAGTPFESVGTGRILLRRAWCGSERLGEGVDGRRRLKREREEREETRRI